MVCNGICQAASSYIFGRLVKYTGRIVVFVIAALINYGTIILMFLWEPVESQMILLFVIAGLWGIADAIWQTQVICKALHSHYQLTLISPLYLSATYTVLYTETDPSALAKYRLWKSVGFVITYSVRLPFIPILPIKRRSFFSLVYQLHHHAVVTDPALSVSLR